MPKEMKEGSVWLEKEGVICTITLNNPPLNVLDEKLKDDLSEACRIIENDLDATVVVIKGGEKAFMAGADIKGFPDYFERSEKAFLSSRKNNTVFLQVENLPQPVIAALEGYALGGGCELALACDFRIAGEGLKIGLPEIKLGLFPGAGGTQRLPRLIGKVLAKKMMMLGDNIDAQKALQIGLIDQIAPQGKAYSEAMKFARELATRPGTALKMIKSLVNRGSEMEIEQGLFWESASIERVFKTQDIQEGVDAFLKKRDPKFKHF